MPLQFTRQSFPLLPLAGLGAAGMIYSLINAEWHMPSTVITLTILLVLIELLPLRLGKINYAFTFPILFALRFATGGEATVIIGVLMLASINMMQGKPWQKVVFNTSSRAVALVLAEFATMLVHPLLGDERLVSHGLIDLAVQCFVFTTVTTVLVRWYLFKNMDGRGSTLSFFLLWLMSISSSFFINGIMLWMAYDPKYAGPGSIGTLFYFIPLVGVTFVVHLLTNLTRANKSLETLFVVSQSINQQNDLPTVLSHVISEATKLVGGSYGMLYLVEEDGTLKRVTGTSEVNLLKRIPMQVGIVGQVAHLGKPMLIHDAERDTRVLRTETQEDTRSLLVVPIHIEDRVVGVMSLGKKQSYAFRDDDVKMMTIFATHAGVAMRNAQYMEEQEKRLLLEERNRLAREIHDGLAQDLASAILQVEMMKRSAPREMELPLTELQEMVRKTATMVRHSIYSLRPAPYSHVGLVPALRAHLDEVRATTGIATHLSAKLQGDRLPSKVSQTVFAICTEAVKNAAKHSKATDLWVTLESDGVTLMVTVKDNGVGFHFGQAILQAAERKSFGIENLHSIADDVGGMLDYVTAPGEGTLVSLEITLEEVECDENSRVAVR
ncbi:GAF domain-containing sensor histidine kinase [Tumebacillus sp. ITR2]|uniref:histidine kinase n=1 Tax=Tumebacillus amylolyticus TaxID=2801339 RepID=A0ABS1J6J5_9BACL|nr:GAF domain-containing sensor histidine kinase [Tumebacillus amylolyticus]MBL0385884.1 GAF domain-containing sensor histidine kinase [Tumebacillus amylolyticus]